MDAELAPAVSPEFNGWSDDNSISFCHLFIRGPLTVLWAPLLIMLKEIWMTKTELFEYSHLAKPSVQLITELREKQKSEQNTLFKYLAPVSFSQFFWYEEQHVKHCSKETVFFH